MTGEILRWPEGDDLRQGFAATGHFGPNREEEVICEKGVDVMLLLGQEYQRGDYN